MFRLWCILLLFSLPILSQGLPVTINWRAEEDNSSQRTDIPNLGTNHVIVPMEDKVLKERTDANIPEVSMLKTRNLFSRKKFAGMFNGMNCLNFRKKNQRKMSRIQTGSSRFASFSGSDRFQQSASGRFKPQGSSRSLSSSDNGRLEPPGGDKLQPTESPKFSRPDNVVPVNRSG